MLVKILAPTIFLILSLALAVFITSRFTLKLDLSKTYNIEPITPPEMRIAIQGVGGDRVVVGFPGIFDSEGTPLSQSESLIMTDKNVEEIRKALSAIEFQKWELMTKVPPSLIKFDLLIHSYSSSPNGGKDSLEVKLSDGSIKKSERGEKVLLGENFKFEELPTVMSGTSITATGPIYQAFYSAAGEFVPQSTGALIIRPSPTSQFYIWVGSLVFVMALFTFVKKLLLSSQEIKEIADFFS